MATLSHFLHTGELGPVRLGMSETEVIALLGQPQDESVTRHPQILKYGGLQLTFLGRLEARERKLAYIGLYFSPRAEPIPEPVRPADFTVTPETTIANVREFLTKVSLEESAFVEDEEATYMMLQSGARITFDDQKLQSIIVATRVASPPKKQISISISKETWSQLKALARQSNRSVSELCAEWITQEANELRHDGVR